MKKGILTISLGMASLFCYGQDFTEEVYDSLMIHSDVSSSTKLKFFNYCENAKVVALQDIENQSILVLTAGEIGQVKNTTDKEFEKRYNITFFRHGDLAAKRECLLNYNMIIFDYLTKRYGNSWMDEIRKDVYGLKEWKKLRKKKRRNTPFFINYITKDGKASTKRK